MESTDQTDDQTTCPECGHVNIAGAAFCARCGRRLDDEPADAEIIDVDSDFDSQSTSVITPIGDAAAAPGSPWAPSSGPASTTTLPIPPGYEQEEDLPATPPEPRARGVRGFVLGVVAVVLIAMVLAVYIYAAWLSDAARSTIQGWIPWV